MNEQTYSLLPDAIRYHRKLSANAKLLFSEICLETDDSGVCVISNQEIIDRFAVSERSVQSWLKQLKDEKYITIRLLDEKTRHIKVTVKGAETFVKGCKNVRSIYNNIYNNINNINNNNNNSIDNIYSKEIRQAYTHIVRLFDPIYRPTGNLAIQSWCDVLIECQKLKYSLRDVWVIVNNTRADDFWRNRFTHLLMLTRKNKNDILWIDYFANQYAKQIKNERFNQ